MRTCDRGGQHSTAQRCIICMSCVYESMLHCPAAASCPCATAAACARAPRAGRKAAASRARSPAGSFRAPTRRSERATAAARPRSARACTHARRGRAPYGHVRAQIFGNPDLCFGAQMFASVFQFFSPGARPTGMCARKYSETRTCVSARKCSQVCSSFFLLARVLLFALSKKRAGCTAQMPPAQACVCVFCGAMMGTRRGLRIHVRKMHASAGDRNQKGAALAYAIFAPPSLQAQSGDSGSNISLLGTGPRGGCFAAVERQPRAVCAPPPLRAQSGDAEAARRALPLARPVYAISTQGGLYAPAAQVPATLCFGKAGISDKHPLSVPQAGATVHDLAKMHVHFLLNPV